MDKIFQREIKGLIHEFPEVGAILETFQVGCTTCQVGTCLLKDIVNIHPLDADQELDLMTQIAEAVYSGQETEIKIPERKPTLPWSKPSRDSGTEKLRNSKAIAGRVLRPETNIFAVENQSVTTFLHFHTVQHRL